MARNDDFADYSIAQDRYISRATRNPPTHFDWETWRKIGQPGQYQAPPGVSSRFSPFNTGAGRPNYGITGEDHYNEMGSVGAAIGGVANLVGGLIQNRLQKRADSGGGSGGRGRRGSRGNIGDAGDDTDDMSIGADMATDRSQNLDISGNDARSSSRGRRGRGDSFTDMTRSLGINMVQGSDVYGDNYGQNIGGVVGDVYAPFQSGNSGGVQNTGMFFGGRGRGGNTGGPTQPGFPPPPPPTGGTSTPPTSPPPGGGGTSVTPTYVSPPPSPVGPPPPTRMQAPGGGTPALSQGPDRPMVPMLGPGGSTGGGSQTQTPDRYPVPMGPGVQRTNPSYGTNDPLAGTEAPVAGPRAVGAGTSQEAVEGPSQKLLDKGEKVYDRATQGSTEGERQAGQQAWHNLGFQGPFRPEPEAPGAPSPVRAIGSTPQQAAPQGPTMAQPQAQTTPGVVGPREPMVMGPRGAVSKEKFHVDAIRQSQGLPYVGGANPSYEGVDMSKVDERVRPFLTGAPAQQPQQAPAKKAATKKQPAKSAEGPKSVASKKAPAKKASTKKTSAKGKGTE